MTLKLNVINDVDMSGVSVWNIGSAYLDLIQATAVAYITRHRVREVIDLNPKTSSESRTASCSLTNIHFEDAELS